MTAVCHKTFVTLQGVTRLLIVFFCNKLIYLPFLKLLIMKVRHGFQVLMIFLLPFTQNETVNTPGRIISETDSCFYSYNRWNLVLHTSDGTILPPPCAFPGGSNLPQSQLWGSHRGRRCEKPHYTRKSPCTGLPLTELTIISRNLKLHCFFLFQ